VKILTIAEHYPSPFKAYHDAQFERFVLDGHDLTICAFGYHAGELNPAVRRHSLHQKTTYLPATLKDLPPTAARALGCLLVSPGKCAWRISTLMNAQRAGKRKLLDCVRATLLPQGAPNLCIVHNLRALVHAQLLREIYPNAVIAFYFHGGEVPGVPSPDPQEVVQAFGAADIVFTNTQSSKAHAIERGCNPQKVCICPVGFNFDDFPDPVGRAYLAGRRLNVLMAGRISEEKGMMLGVQAFPFLDYLDVLKMGLIKQAKLAAPVNHRRAGRTAFMYWDAQPKPLQHLAVSSHHLPRGRGGSLEPDRCPVREGNEQYAQAVCSGSWCRIFRLTCFRRIP